MNKQTVLLIASGAILTGACLIFGLSLGWVAVGSLAVYLCFVWDGQ